MSRLPARLHRQVVARPLARPQAEQLLGHLPHLPVPVLEEAAQRLLDQRVVEPGQGHRRPAAQRRSTSQGLEDRRQALGVPDGPQSRHRSLLAARVARVACEDHERRDHLGPQGSRGVLTGVVPVALGPLADQLAEGPGRFLPDERVGVAEAGQEGGQQVRGGSPLGAPGLPGQAAGPSPHRWVGVPEGSTEGRGVELAQPAQRPESSGPHRGLLVLQQASGTHLVAPVPGEHGCSSTGHRGDGRRRTGRRVGSVPIGPGQGLCRRVLSHR